MKIFMGVCRLSAFFVVLIWFALPAAWAIMPINTDPQGLAIEGYDTVAYFTKEEAVKGSEAFAYRWRGATWHFTSRAHLEMFTSNPENYAPQYGGY